MLPTTLDHHSPRAKNTVLFAIITISIHSRAEKAQRRSSTTRIRASTDQPCQRQGLVVVSATSRSRLHRLVGCWYLDTPSSMARVAGVLARGKTSWRRCARKPPGIRICRCSPTSRYLGDQVHIIRIREILLFGYRLKPWAWCNGCVQSVSEELRAYLQHCTKAYLVLQIKSTSSYTFILLTAVCFEASDL